MKKIIHFLPYLIVILIVSIFFWPILTSSSFVSSKPCYTDEAGNTYVCGFISGPVLIDESNPNLFDRGPVGFMMIITILILSFVLRSVELIGKKLRKQQIFWKKEMLYASLYVLGVIMFVGAGMLYEFMMRLLSS